MEQVEIELNHSRMGLGKVQVTRQRLGSRALAAPRVGRWGSERRVGCRASLTRSSYITIFKAFQAQNACSRVREFRPQAQPTKLDADQIPIFSAIAPQDDKKNSEKNT